MYYFFYSEYQKFTKSLAHILRWVCLHEVQNKYLNYKSSMGMQFCPDSGVPHSK